ncbi:MAG: hypothetical protein IPG62_14360 [Sphingomonadales bacterium]|nr:hypothetical protein [Sphingomonadales bacterium]
MTERWEQYRGLFIISSDNMPVRPLDLHQSGNCAAGWYRQRHANLSATRRFNVYPVLLERGDNLNGIRVARLREIVDTLCQRIQLHFDFLAAFKGSILSASRLYKTCMRNAKVDKIRYE